MAQGSANGQQKNAGVTPVPHSNGATPPAARRAPDGKNEKNGNYESNSLTTTSKPKKDAVQVDISIRVPVMMEIADGLHQTRQITINDLTPRQTQVYHRLWRRLVADGAVMVNGRMVSNQHQYDAIRWLLDSIADALGLP